MRKNSILITVSVMVTLVLLVACGPTATPVEVTRIVAGTPVVVTATPAPVPKEKAPDVLGIFPRSETLIAAQLTGRVGSPDNFNEWVGWSGGTAACSS
jgi:peptide/nickel transport system substrate-binding protein